jgi:hypothetical protein
MAYTTIDDPSAHFQTKIYSGQNSVQSVTNDGNSDLKPDWLWIKSRNDSDIHVITDSTRGTDLYLQTNNDAGEVSSTGDVESFDTDGFSLAGVNDRVNTNGGLYVAWQWKANGGTTSSNTDGGITTTIQANTTAGFSIVTYTGNGATGQTVGHGLGAVPKIIISKDRGGSSNVPTWRTYHVSNGATKYLQLPQTDAASTFTDWNDTTPTSSVYSIGGSGGYRPTNTNSTNYVAYVFAEVQGFSRINQYVGNGNADGPFTYTGFKPAYVFIKESTNAGTDWAIMDSARTPTNANGTYEFTWANLTAAEFTDGDSGINMEIDFLSNGFKIRTSRNELNRNASAYVFMAFAENPFTTSTGIPTTAR